MSAWSPRVSSSKRRASLQQALERRVVVRRLVVEEHQVLGARHLAELDADDVARVAPVGLHADRLGERVHRVEDHQVGVAEEARERLGLGAVLELVLRVGGVDHRLAVVLEAVAVGVAAVQLQVRRDREAGDLVAACRARASRTRSWRRAARTCTGKHGGDCCRRKACSSTSWQPWMRIFVPGHVGRPEEGEAHDVVPVHVGHEDVDGRRARACLASTCTPKGRAPLPMSQTKYSSPGISSSTHGVWPPKVWVSEKSSSERGEGVRLLVARRSVRPEACSSACASLSRMSRRGERHRDRAAGSPEAHAHRAR